MSLKTDPATTDPRRFYRVGLLPWASNEELGKLASRAVTLIKN